MKSKRIEQFISQLQRRLNLEKLLRVSSWVLCAVGILFLIHAGYYRYFGESVPWPTAYGLLIIAAITLPVAWVMNLTKPVEAARVADREFGLKDSLSTSLSFSEAKKDGEVYELQQLKAEELVKNREAKEMPLRYNLRWLAAGLLMTLIAIGMGFLPPSAAVLERINQENLTESRTEEIQKAMEEAVAEMTRDLTDEEKEVLKPDELKKWVKDLKATKDQKEALRQLARFEQKVAKAIAGMEAKKDEESLKLAAFELSKSDQSAARQLGKHLENKEFDKAAEDLKKAGDNAKEKTAKQGPKKSKFNKDELKKLREMTKRMADAARKQSRAAQPRPNGKMSKGNPNAKPNNSGKNMDQMMAELDDAAAEAQELAEAAEGDMDPNDMQNGQEAGDFDKQMARMQAGLNKLNAKNKMKQKLKGLRAGLSQAQQFAMGKGQGNMPGMGQGMGQGKGPGQGKGIGQGTDNNRRKLRDELKDNGQFSSLKGVKGSGPSLTTVEDADSGTGVSRRTGVAQQREYQRQLESFVSRDDVPEDVKLGVKDYFEQVHQVQESQK